MADEVKLQAPLFPPRARLALAAFIVGGAVAGLTYRSWAMEFSRPRPRSSPCFMLARIVLREPALESGTEPVELENGETAYLTSRADRAARCAGIMGDGKSTQKRLAAVLVAEEGPPRAKTLLDILERLPKDASGDVEAAAFGMLAEETFSKVPPSEARTQDQQRATDLVECRFDGVGCSTPTRIPIVTWGAAAAGVLGLLLVLVELIRGLGRRRAAAKRGGSRRAKGAAAASTILMSMLLSACQAAPRPAEAPPRAEPPPRAAPAPGEGLTTPPPPPTSAPAPSSSTEPAAPASSGTPSPRMPREAPPNGACPDDMILVDGEYCTDVEHKCLKSWYDKSNKKEVCEEFAPKATCTGTKVKKRFCVDRFAWPNVRGERPEVMNNFYQAQVKCAAVDKRICTESEWTMSCEGPEMKPFPYGWKRDPTKCNGDHLWDEPHMKAVGKRDPKELARLWHGVPNGAQPECISDYGVPDLPGNTDDIASSETYSSGFRGKFDSVTTGGPWYKGTRNQCRPKIYTHDEGFYYYYLGFRCCAEADGKPTDPRTPKQRKGDWKFSRVEGLGRFTIGEMKKKLEEKKTGKCSCKDKDTLCKTMCGTLLGPDAKDADLKAPRE